MAGAVASFLGPAGQRAEREVGCPVAPHVGTPTLQDLGRAAENGKWAESEGMRSRRIVFFSIFLFYFKVLTSNSIEIQTHVLNFNFSSVKIIPNINSTVYNIIFYSFPYHLFMEGVNGFIKKFPSLSLFSIPFWFTNLKFKSKIKFRNSNF